MMPPTLAQIRQRLIELPAVEDWSQRNNIKGLLHDSLWGKYRCHSRLRNDSAAADALIALRMEREKHGIAGYFQRRRH
ncbi:MAG TPA: hypothetical protein ENK04_10420 [Gammaproteobacteria bacterium]|nr:hypothetical protein [Gammaproteobacteria bacterium]